jgi:hypothetical protein
MWLLRLSALTVLVLSGSNTHLMAQTYPVVELSGELMYGRWNFFLSETRDFSGWGFSGGYNHNAWFGVAGGIRQVRASSQFSEATVTLVGVGPRWTLRPIRRVSLFGQALGEFVSYDVVNRRPLPSLPDQVRVSGEAAIALGIAGGADVALTRLVGVKVTTSYPIGLSAGGPQWSVGGTVRAGQRRVPPRAETVREKSLAEIEFGQGLTLRGPRLTTSMAGGTYWIDDTWGVGAAYTRSLGESRLDDPIDQGHRLFVGNDDLRHVRVAARHRRRGRAAWQVTSGIGLAFGSGDSIYYYESPDGLQRRDTTERGGWLTAELHVQRALTRRFAIRTGATLFWAPNLEALVNGQLQPAVLGLISY